MDEKIRAGVFGWTPGASLLSTAAAICTGVVNLRGRHVVKRTKEGTKSFLQPG